MFTPDLPYSDDINNKYFVIFLFPIYNTLLTDEVNQALVYLKENLIVYNIIYFTAM